MEETWQKVFESISGYVPHLLGALAILVLGWIVAVLISATVRKVFQRSRLDDKLAAWVRGKEGEEGSDISGGIGKAVFWAIMVLVLVAFFEALRLTLVVDPLNSFMNQIFKFMPQLFGALILLLIAWIIASALRLVITRVMGAAKLDERLGTQVGKGEAKGLMVTKSIGDVVYWLIFLLFLPAILGALNLQGLLEPVQGMLNKLLGYLPNLVAAGLIGVVGWFVARIVRQLVASLLAASGADGLSDRVGLASISKLVGLIVYVLILIPVMIAALNALALDAITTPASRMLDMIFEAIPVIFAAMLLVTLAYAVGKVVTTLITDVLTGMGFNSILAKLGIGGVPQEGKRTPSQVVGYLTWVAIMLLAAFEAADLLGFKALSKMLSELAVLGGHIVLGLVIFGIGLYLANVASEAIKTGGSAESAFLAAVAKIAILLLAGSMAIRYMGLANEIINLAFGLLLGATAVAAAIAFGIGGRDIAARKLEEWTQSRKSA